MNPHTEQYQEDLISASSGSLILFVYADKLSRIYLTGVSAKQFAIK